MAELETGAVVASHYVVVSVLGAGGMGVVYRARDTRTNTLFAIKVLREARGDLATRFIREARIASALEHPNVARVHEVLALPDGAPAIVMELLDGESLGARLARAGKLDDASIARICASVVAAIEAAHERGVVHRDLKPDNIFLCEDGSVKVLDFGIAKVTLDSSDPAITAAALTETGQILGTPQYMAPEMIFGEKDIDARADVWALGVILYQALAGVRPFDGANPGQVFKAIALDPPVPLAERAPSASAELVAITERMLVHARAERIADLGEIRRVLDRVSLEALGEAETLQADGAAVVEVALAPKVRLAAPPTRAAGRPRRVVVVAATSALAIGITTVVAMAMRSTAPVSPDVVPTSSPVMTSSPSAQDVKEVLPESAPSATPPAPSSATPPAPSSATPAPSSATPPSAVVTSTPHEPTTSVRSASSAAAPAPKKSSTPDAAPANRSGPLKRDEF